MQLAMRTLATAAAAAATSVSFNWATTCNSADGTRAGKCNNLASLAGGSAAGLYYLARSSGGTFALRKMNQSSQSTPASWPNYACDIDNIYDGCSVDASMTALTCPLQSRMVGLTDDGDGLLIVAAYTAPTGSSFCSNPTDPSVGGPINFAAEAKGATGAYVVRMAVTSTSSDFPTVQWSAALGVVTSVSGCGRACGLV